MNGVTDRGRKTAENRIPTPPGGREPPGHILYRLRVVDEDAELHYIGGGRWAVGVHEPSSYRRKVAGQRKQTAIQMDDARKYRMAWLTYHGFSFTFFHDVEPGRAHTLWEVVPRYRKLDWQWRNEQRDLERQTEAAGMNWRGRSSDEEFAAELEARIHDAYPYIFGKRTHVPMS